MNYYKNKSTRRCNHEGFHPDHAGPDKPGSSIGGFARWRICRQDGDMYIGVREIF